MQLGHPQGFGGEIDASTTAPPRHRVSQDAAAAAHIEDLLAGEAASWSIQSSRSGLI